MPELNALVHRWQRLARCSEAAESYRAESLVVRDGQFGRANVGSSSDPSARIACSLSSSVIA
jgi:hypothetical protein